MSCFVYQVTFKLYFNLQPGGFWNGLKIVFTCILYWTKYLIVARRRKQSSLKSKKNVEHDYVRIFCMWVQKMEFWNLPKKLSK